MQITIRPLTLGSPIRLTGNRPTEGISGGVIQHGRIVEQIAKIRAEASTFRSRRNLAHSLTFSIFREHSDEGAAGLYWLTHAQSLPDECNVDFEVVRYNGTLAARLTLANAIVTASQGDWAGVSTTFNYTVQGGKFTT